MTADNQVKIDISADAQGFAAAMAQAQTHLDRMAKSVNGMAGESIKANQQINALQHAAGGMDQALQRATRTIVGLFSAWKVYEMVKDVVLLNARYETLGISMGVVGANAGYSAAQMNEAAASMQKAGISMIEARQQAMRLVQAHIDLSQSTKLARIAQDAAVIGNMNSSEAFATMIHGIQTGQTDVLRTIGLNISMEQSYKLMAAQLHKNVDALTQNEKTQGVLNAVMLAGEGIAGTYEAAMGTAGKQINSMTRYLEDLKVRQGEVFNELLAVAVMAFTDHLKDANGELDEMAKNSELKQWGEDISDIFAAVADNINNAVGAVKILNLYAQYSRKSLKNPLDLGGVVDLNKQMMVEIDKVLATEDRFSKALAKRREARAEAAATEAAALKAQGEKYSEIRAFYAAQYEQGLMKEVDYIRTVQTLLVQMYGDKHKYADTSTTGSGTDPYKAIKKSADDFIKSLEKEAAQLGMTADQKKLMDAATVMLTLHTDKERAAFMASATAAVQRIKVFDEATAAAKVQEEGIKRLAQEEAARIKVLDDSVAADQKTLDAMTLKNDLLERGIESVTAMAVAELELTLASVDFAKATYEEVDALEKRLDIAKQIATQAGRGEAVQAAKDATKAATDSQVSMWKTIDSTAQQTFVSIFQSGKSAFDRLRDTLKNGLYALLYEITVKKWLISIAASVGGTGGAAYAQAAGAAGDGTNALGMMSTGKNLYGAASMLTYDAGIASGMTYGTGFGTQQSMMLASQEAGMGSASGTLGAYGGAALGAYYGYQQHGIGGAAVYGTAGYVGGAALAGGMAGTGAMAGGMAALAAIPVWGWAALAALAIFGWDSKGGGPKSGGDAFGQVSAGAYGSMNASELAVAQPNLPYGTGTPGEGYYTPNNGDSQVGEFLKGVGADINSTIKGLGGSAEGLMFGVGFDTDPQGTAGSRVTSGVYNADGSTVYTRQRDVGRDADMAKEFETEARVMLLSALQAVDLSSVLDPMLDALGDVSAMTDAQIQSTLSALQAIGPATAETVQKIFGEAFDVSAFAALSAEGENVVATFARLSGVFTATNTVADMLGQDTATAFGAVGLASAAMRQQLIDGAGGMDALAAQSNSYYQNFYSESERSARALEVSGNAVNAAFADMNMAVPDSIESFRSLVSGLDLSTAAGQEMYQALMDISPAFASVASASRNMIQSIASSLDSLRGGNTQSVLQAQFNLNSAMSTLTAATPWITSFEQLSTITLDDASHYSAANQVLIANALGAGAALQNLLNQATPSAVSNPPVSWSGSDSGNDSAASAIASERQQLQDQLDSLTMTSVQLLAKQRAALDASNRALFDQIQLVTAAQQAQQAQQAAQQELADLMRQSADALGQTITSLNRANMVPVSRYEDMRREFDQLYAGAAGLGGADLASRAAQLNSLAQPLMDAARESYASSPAYQAALNSITGSLADLQTRLGAEAPRDYQAESLAVLQDIRALLGGEQTTLSGLPGHADGLSYVPYDDYGARLHQGEAVIDAGTMAVLRRYGLPAGSGGGGSPEQLAEQRKTTEELRALVRLQSAANQALLEKLEMMEKRLGGIESKSRMVAAA